MIELHRLGHAEDVFFLNPSLVVSIEAHPDTTLVLATGARLVVADSIESVVSAINGWHEQVAVAALKGSPTVSNPANQPTPLRPT